jgi:hypothetical protein
MLKNKKLSFCIVGSEDFKDSSFATSLLEQLYLQTGENVGQLHYVSVPGVAASLKEWASSHHIDVHPIQLQPLLKWKTLPDGVELPTFAVKADRYYQEGGRLLKSLRIDLVVALPDNEGNIIAVAKDFKIFSELAEISYFNCSELFRFVKIKFPQNLIDNKKPPEGGFYILNTQSLQLTT